SAEDPNFEFTLEELTVSAFFTSAERAKDRLIVGLFLIPIVYGAIANVLLFIAVMGSKSMRNTPSYFFLIEITICDLILVFFSIVHQLAGVIFRQAYYGNVFSPLNYVQFFVTQCAWWTFVCTLAVTAFNRFVCIVFPHHYERVFSRNCSLCFALITAIIGICFSAPNLSPCCRLIWFFDDWVSSYYPVNTWYIQFDLSVNIIASTIIVVCYAFVCWRVRQVQAKARKGSKNRRELRICLQVGLMCGVYIFNFTTWNWIPYMGQSRWLNAFIASTFYIQSALHPTIAFLFNGQIRNECIVLLGIKTRSQVSSGPMNPSNPSGTINRTTNATVMS
ncbi:hypothetical protein PMAYCL1PPCAC_13170, partial [Pristionchus mayeri]